MHVALQEEEQSIKTKMVLYFRSEDISNIYLLIGGTGIAVDQY